MAVFCNSCTSFIYYFANCWWKKLISPIGDPAPPSNHILSCWSQSLLRLGNSHTGRDWWNFRRNLVTFLCWAFCFVKLYIRFWEPYKIERDGALILKRTPLLMPWGSGTTEHSFLSCLWAGNKKSVRTFSQVEKIRHNMQKWQITTITTDGNS